MSTIVHLYTFKVRHCIGDNIFFRDIILKLLLQIFH